MRDNGLRDKVAGRFDSSVHPQPPKQRVKAENKTPLRDRLWLFLPRLEPRERPALCFAYRRKIQLTSHKRERNKTP